MALRFYLDGAEVVGKIRRPSPNTPGGGFAGLTSSFAGSEYGSGGVEIDDIAGSLNIVGWRPFYVEEDTASPTRIWTGFINARRISKSDVYEAPGTARVWDCDLGDLNLILGLKVFRQAAAKRPLETNVARIAWMLAHWPAPAWPVFDNGGVSSNPSNFDEDDLRDKFPVEVLSSMALDSSIFSLYWDATQPAGEEISLFYGAISAVRGDITAVKLSNGTDVNHSTILVAHEGQSISREPGFTYSSISMNTKAGRSYYSNATTASTFIDRDLVYTTDRIGNQATADRRGAQLLARASTERDVLTCTVHLLSADVNKIREGYRIQVKFTHLPAYTSYTWVAIQKRVIRRPDNGNTAYYEVDLELSNSAPLASGEGGGGVGGFPHPPPSVPGLVQQKGAANTVTLDTVPVNGDLLMMWVTMRTFATYPDVPAGWTQVGPDIENDTGPYHSARLMTRIASSESGTYTNSAGTVVHVSEWSGATLGAYVSRIDQGPGTAVDAGGPITPAAANAIVVGNGLYGGFATAGGVTPGPGITELFEQETPGGLSPTCWVGYATVPNPASTSVNGTMGNTTMWAGVTYTLLPGGGANPPQPGQWVYLETATPAPDGTTTTFQTANPYSPGSLTVYVDQLDQTSALVAQSPAGGILLAKTRPSIPSLPTYLLPFTDPTWNTSIVRVSNTAGRRQAYARYQPWNSDGSKALLGFTSPGRMINGTTYADIGSFAQLSGAIWSNTDNNKLFGVDGSGVNILYSQNATTAAITALHTFTGYTAVAIGGDYTRSAWEGGISDDDRYMCLTGYSGGAPHLISYDLVANTVLGDIAAPAGLDNAQISRSGTYIIVVATGGTRRYVRDLSSYILLTTTTNHGDNALDGAGNEIYVTNNAPGVVSYLLSSGASTLLLPAGTAFEYGHTSGRSSLRNGWVYLSVYDNTATAGRKGMDQLVAVKTDGSGEIEVFGFANHTNVGTYADQPHAVPSRDGTRVMFASEWGATNVYAYVASAPAVIGSFTLGFAPWATDIVQVTYQGI